MISQKQSVIQNLNREKMRGTWDVVCIGGKQWEYIDFTTSKQLRRQVPVGQAEITEVLSLTTEGSNLKFFLKINSTISGDPTICHMAHFDALEEAASSAELFQLTTRKYAGRTWYSIRNDEHYEEWVTIFRSGHTASLKRNKDIVRALRGYAIEHKYSLREGEIYEIRASRYESEATSPINSFEEAAAIACTLPAFLATLMHVAPPVSGESKVDIG